MPKCFVMQPFDNGKYDQRFEEIFKPAIIAAGFDPYRVDKDYSVQIPIEAIEENIASSQICFAEITEDNPSVWYELGFAFASKKPVVMVCSDERRQDKFPFDIQHRHIIRYKSNAPSDYETLKEEITNRIRATANTDEQIRQLGATEAVAPVDGVTQPEIMVLAAILGNMRLPDDGAVLHEVTTDLQRSVLKPVGITLGQRGLMTKGIIWFDDVEMENAGFGPATIKFVKLTGVGWKWIEQNQDKFQLMEIPKRNVKSEFELGPEEPDF